MRKSQQSRRSGSNISRKANDDEIDVSIPDYLREAFKLPRRSDSQPYIIKKESPKKENAENQSPSFSINSKTSSTHRSYHHSIITVNKKPISPIPIQNSPPSSSSLIPPPPPPPPPPEDEFSKTDSTISSHGQISDSDLSSILQNLSMAKSEEVSPIHPPPPPPHTATAKSSSTIPPQLIGKQQSNNERGNNNNNRRNINKKIKSTTTATTTTTTTTTTDSDNNKTKEIDLDEKLIKRINNNNNNNINTPTSPSSSPYINPTSTPKNTPRYDLLPQNKKYSNNNKNNKNSKELTVTPLVDKTVQLEKESNSIQSQSQQQQQNNLQKQIIDNKLKQQQNNNSNNSNINNIKSTDSTPNTSRTKSPKKKVKHQITKQDILWAISKVGKEQIVESIYEQICRNSLE